MKIKLSWIAFIPIVIVMVIFKYIQLNMQSGDLFLTMNNIQLNYFIVILGAVICAISLVFSLLDKKTAGIYPIHKNPLAGVFAFLSAVVIVFSSVMDMLSMFTNSEYKILWLINALFAVVAAVVFILMSVAHFTGKAKVRGLSFLYVIPALWCVTKMIAMFSELTSTSARANDMTVIVAYAFTSLWMMYFTEIFIVMNKRTSTKKTFIFGLPATALFLVCIASSLLKGIADGTIITIEVLLPMIEMFALAVYILSIQIEITGNALTFEQVKIQDDNPIDSEIEHDMSENVQNSYRDIAKKIELENGEEADDDIPIPSMDTMRTPINEEVEPRRIRLENSDAEANDTSTNEHKPSTNSEKGAFTQANSILDKLLDDIGD